MSKVEKIIKELSKNERVALEVMRIILNRYGYKFGLMRGDELIVFKPDELYFIN